jgi:hypothetical protein
MINIATGSGYSPLLSEAQIEAYFFSGATSDGQPSATQYVCCSAALTAAAQCTLHLAHPCWPLSDGADECWKDELRGSFQGPVWAERSPNESDCLG